VVPAAESAAASGARPASEAAPPVPVASLDGGYVVQLGAFASFANAQNFVAHLANQMAATGVEPKIRQVNGLYRVFVGPYTARDDARRTSDRLREALGLSSTIAVH
jgi:rare lipoprotein A